MATVRRSQAERSATTREALLDAAIDCLLDEGYANTTTSRVAERAGVSRGAHLHHFQTRAALVAAAIEQLARRRFAEFLEAMETLGPVPVPEALDLLWSHYAGPLFQGAIDLWADARTDAELRAHLVEVEHTFDRQTVELTRRLFPTVADGPDFEHLVRFAMATVRGLALLDTLDPDDGRSGQQWRFCRARFVELFEAATPAAAPRPTPSPER